ncbi:MAG: cation diffusion facilitator family transporter [Clostridiales bacterium]|nr:cation diffusion facilitator family transporter [Clostridiales bacterium]
MTKKQIEKIINKNNPDNVQSSEKAGMISGITGIICNIILCAVKFFVGSAANSVSVAADAVNNLSDAGSGIIPLAGAKLSAKPVDKEYPFGHGRLEYVSALVVSFLIILMGLELGKSSVEKIISPQTVKFSAWKVIVLIISVGIKLWMTYINNNLFKVTGNLNAKATRQDSLGDCVATTATIISLIISHYTGFTRADGIIGLSVAVIILISGIGIIKDIIGPLLGQPPSKELVSEIERIMLSEE